MQKKNTKKNVNVKRNDEYAEIIKRTNSFGKFMNLWKNEFAPARYIGHVNNLYDKYHITDYFLSGQTSEECVRRFIELYLQDYQKGFSYKSVFNGLIRPKTDKGRSYEQIIDIAENIKRRCKDIGLTDVDTIFSDTEYLGDVIIGHACYETVLGGLSELKVRRYLVSKGRNIRTEFNKGDESVIDSFGCDICLSDKNDKIVGFIQVKPVSFMFGRNKSIMADRAKCYDNKVWLESFVKNKPWYFRTEEDGGVDTDIRYIFYDKDRSYNFIKFPIDGKQKKFIRVEDFTDTYGNPLLSYSEVSKYETESFNNF